MSESAEALREIIRQRDAEWHRVIDSLRAQERDSARLAGLREAAAVCREQCTGDHSGIGHCPPCDCADAIERLIAGAGDRNNAPPESSGATDSAKAEPAPTCQVCGEPMPSGEEMFKFHGYSGPCPKPPLYP